MKQAAKCILTIIMFFTILQSICSQNTPHSQRSIKAEKPQVKNYRAQIRAENLQKIAQFNAKYGQYYTSKENRFTHLTIEQLRANYLGGNLQPQTLQIIEKSKKKVTSSDIETEAAPKLNNKLQVPSGIPPNVFYVDWNGLNGSYVTPAKDQGGCGSCWAFASIGQLQSYLLWKHNIFTDLSQQQVVSCSPTAGGCGGGQLDDLSRYLVQYNGKINWEKSYPYRGTRGTCDTVKAANGKYTIKGYIRTRDCNSLTQALLAMKPISMCLYIDQQWFSYSTGVIPNCDAKPVGGHCVLVTGAKSNGNWADISNNYWIVKNSWSAGYGQNGFLRLYRNGSDSAIGYCAMCRYGLYSL